MRDLDRFERGFILCTMIPSLLFAGSGSAGAFADGRVQTGVWLALFALAAAFFVVVAVRNDP